MKDLLEAHAVLEKRHEELRNSEHDTRIALKRKSEETISALNAVIELNEPKVSVRFDKVYSADRKFRFHRNYDHFELSIDEIKAIYKTLCDES